MVRVFILEIEFDEFEKGIIKRGQFCWCSFYLLVFYSIINLSQKIRIHIVSLITYEFDKYVILLQKNKKPNRKVEHSTSFNENTILKKDGKICEVLQLLQTRSFEIR